MRSIVFTIAALASVVNLGQCEDVSITSGALEIESETIKTEINKLEKTLENATEREILLAVHNAYEGSISSKKAILSWLCRLSRINESILMKVYEFTMDSNIVVRRTAGIILRKNDNDKMIFKSWLKSVILNNSLDYLRLANALLQITENPEQLETPILAVMHDLIDPEFIYKRILLHVLFLVNNNSMLGAMECERGIKGNCEQYQIYCSSLIVRACRNGSEHALRILESLVEDEKVDVELRNMIKSNIRPSKEFLSMYENGLQSTSKLNQHLALLGLQMLQNKELSLSTIKHIKDFIAKCTDPAIVLFATELIGHDSLKNKE